MLDRQRLLTASRKNLYIGSSDHRIGLLLRSGQHLCDWDSVSGKSSHRPLPLTIHRSRCCQNGTQ
ncbi:hypothetical protein C7S18_04605 [Ahniella affigens]|uniref:Uncharacterized protein n=1 Tax=Ahniella affigens TaxID=2021234 RepID=A0A2P1PNV2_9GAMM|nr:hypothetical protein C7S18_04605 [Ahniella affigens]